MNYQNSDFGQDIIKMSLPGKIALVLALMKIINIMFEKYNNNHIFSKMSKILHTLFYSVIYIFLLNWLCSNNKCWMSWIILCFQLIFTLITVLMLFSIVGFVSSLKDEANRLKY